MDYEINKDTLLIMSKDKEKSRVIEKNAEYIIPKETIEVIEHSCEYFGSTYEGRHLGTKNLIGVTHKSPIIIEESNNIIFFPTTSPRLKVCFWLSLINILSYRQGRTAKSTIIEFKNGKKIEIKVSVGSINNQILRASRLDSILSARKKWKMCYFVI